MRSRLAVAVALVAAAALALTLAVSAGAASRPKAPAIAGLTLEGKKVSLAQFRGRPVLINVWSSW